MAGTKISAYSSVGTLASGDLFAVVDVSEPLDPDKNKNATATIVSTYMQNNLLHDSFSDYVSNEHIDWTNASNNLQTTGSATFNEIQISPSANNWIINNSVGNDDLLALYGASDNNSGAGVALYGRLHATHPNKIRFIYSPAGTFSVCGEYNGTDTWDFQANNITTTGALTCGTFTSTGIDDNATSAKLTISDNNITITGESGNNAALINNSFTDGYTILSGTTNNYTGANLVLFGQDHLSTPYYVRFRSATATELEFNGTGNTWDFQANAITTTGALTCGDFTSTGIADTSTTKTSFRVDDVGIVLGSTSQTYYIIHDVGDQSITLSGGSFSNSGANIILYGNTHATNPGVMTFRDAATTTLEYNSSDTWNFQANNITTTGNVTCTNLTFTGTIREAVSNSNIAIAGDVSISAGANLLLYGSTEASFPSNVKFRVGTTEQLTYNGSSLWDFKANNIITTGKVGVSNTSPASQSDFADDLVVGNTTGNHGATILAATTGYSSLHFADVVSTAVGQGQVVYDHTNDDLYFVVNGAEELRNDSSTSTWNFQANAITTTGDITCGNVTLGDKELRIQGTTNTHFNYLAAGQNYISHDAAAFTRFRSATNSNILQVEDTKVYSSVYNEMSIAAQNAPFLKAYVAGTSTRTIDFSIIPNGGVNNTVLDINSTGAAGTGAGIQLSVAGNKRISILGDDFDFYESNGSTYALWYDHSASLWDFQANAITTTGSLTVDNTVLNSDTLSFNNTTQDKVLLYSTTYGIGISGSEFVNFMPATARYSLRTGSRTGTEIFNIDASDQVMTFQGNSSVGTTGPAMEMYYASSTTGYYPWLAFYKSKGTIASPTNMGTGDQMGEIAWGGRLSGVWAYGVTGIWSDLEGGADGNYARLGLWSSRGEIELKGANDTDGGVEIQSQPNLRIQEQAGPPNGKTGYGTLWVKNTTPCELWFTRDNSTDVQLS